MLPQINLSTSRKTPPQSCQPRHQHHFSWTKTNKAWIFTQNRRLWASREQETLRRHLRHHEYRIRLRCYWRSTKFRHSRGRSGDGGRDTRGIEKFWGLSRRVGRMLFWWWRGPHGKGGESLIRGGKRDGVLGMYIWLHIYVVRWTGRCHLDIYNPQRGQALVWGV